MSAAVVPGLWSLADKPATSRYVPERRVFLRWLAADSESELLAAADTVLADPDIEWEDVGIWETDGPAVLMDSTTTGAELDEEYPGGGRPEQSPVPLVAGRWRVHAVHTTGDSLGSVWSSCCPQGCETSGAWSSVGEEDATSEEGKAGPAVVLTFEELDARDVALDGAGTPGQGEPGGDGSQVLAQAECEGT